jgi:hypothetical protein
MPSVEFGKPVVVSTVDDINSGQQFELDVTATPRTYLLTKNASLGRSFLTYLRVVYEGLRLAVPVAFKRARRSRACWASMERG